MRDRRTPRATVFVTIIMGFLAPAMMILALDFSAGCDDGKSSVSASGSRYKIGFANIAEDFPFAVRVREGIERAAKEAGNIDLVVMNNRMDGQTALNNADNFLVQGVKG